ncbi:unnamed protein product [Polarella glacialis]|uniref:Cation/H+ exchanger domain-containing protein n=1 Tax=Polarella glacialis TaxID=89957 RepID=A0A813LYR5_POLGL|nr:unnamed protein product [Polarella glacialis]CAE8741664.1 unnamed protein product [Polarella glacialis]
MASNGVPAFLAAVLIAACQRVGASPPSVPLTDVNILACDGSVVDDRWAVGAVAASPQPLILGRPVRFSLAGSSSYLSNLTLRDIHLSFRLRQSHAEVPIEFEGSLCKAMGYKHPCPSLDSFDIGEGRFAISSHTESWLAAFPGARPGVYDVQLTSWLPPWNSTRSCIHFQQVLRASWTDVFSAIVAFVIASAASWTIGKAFPFLNFPLITGYLLVGAVVGPYGTNLIQPYHVWMLGPGVNNLALSFIAFAAGNEIFFPELRGLLHSIIQHMAWITAATLLVVPLGFLAVGSMASFACQQGLPCQVAIALLTGVICVARSPSATVAVCRELQADGKSVKLVMGITVMSDIVVLVAWALVTPFAQAVCLPGRTFDDLSLLLVLLQFLSIAVVGSLVGITIMGILAIPFERIALGNTIVVYRSMMKGAIIIPLGLLIFVSLEHFSENNKAAWGHKLSIEPLLVCMVGASFAGHYIENREKFTNILEKTAPYVFLPFFTLTGASLALDKIVPMLPLALVVLALRAVAIFCASSLCGRLSSRSPVPPSHAQWLWITLLSQAGLAMSLAMKVKAMFPKWGATFETLILSIVVLNQLLGPPLCKMGLVKLMEGERANIGTTDNNEPLIGDGFEQQHKQQQQKQQQHQQQHQQPADGPDCDETSQQPTDSLNPRKLFRAVSLNLGIHLDESQSPRSTSVWTRMSPSGQPFDSNNNYNNSNNSSNSINISRSRSRAATLQ